MNELHMIIKPSALLDQLSYDWVSPTSYELHMIFKLGAPLDHLKPNWDEKNKMQITKYEC